MKETVSLNDSVIAHLVKLIQVGFLTGTDIVDHFRMIKMTIEDGELFLDADYEKNHEVNVQKMLDEAEKLENKAEDTEG
jgi:riboflavin synthase